MALKLIGRARFVDGKGTDESPYRRVLVTENSDLSKLPKHIADELRSVGVLTGEEDKPKPSPKAS
ncbi:MAG: hypothetical protein LC687_05530 [Actinobacteria bacterium]|nr:hypothetical protein [Actinomycetota bacterium]